MVSLMRLASSNGAHAPDQELHHVVKGQVGEIRAAELVAQIHHAEADGQPVADMMSIVADVDPHHLGAAAADVEDDGALRRFGQQRRTTHKGQLRFLFAGNDVDRKPGFLLHAVQERLAIGGAAAGFGGDETGIGEAVFIQFFLAGFERRQRALHGGVGQ